MKALQIDRFGSLADLQIRDVPDHALEDDEVRIEVEAAGVNPSDVAVALGRFPHATAPRILGRDFAGRVIEGREDLLGAPVWGSGGGELGLTRDGGHAEHLILPAHAVVRRPESLSGEDAGVLGVPFVTAWSALFDLAALEPGEYAIIAGAAGAVGNAAVRLAIAAGAYPIALVVGSDNLSTLEGLDLAGVLYSDRDDVPEGVRKITEGRGANVALNGVGAPVFKPLFGSLAKRGRMIIYSARSGSEAQLDLFPLYRGIISIFGLDTGAFTLEETTRIVEKLTRLLATNAVTSPGAALRFPLSRAREAYGHVNGGAPGKVVLIPDAKFGQ
jgi:NADPH:quinone reductase